MRDELRYGRREFKDALEQKVEQEEIKRRSSSNMVS
jgi:hypothetical protein